MKLSAFWIYNQVYRRRSLQRAASDLGLAPSTVSHAVGLVEEALAMRLFSRSGKGLVATGAAVELASRLADIAAEVEAIYRVISPKDVQARLLGSSITLAALMRFIDVLDLGSLRKAARKAQIGQPQMSRVLDTLESRLGAQLVKRGQTGAYATDTGFQVLAHAKVIRRIWGGLDSSTSERFRRSAVQWVLGGIPPADPSSASARLMGRLVARWAETYSTPLLLKTELGDQLIEGLALQRYDALIVDMEPRADDLCAEMIDQSLLAYYVRPGTDTPGNARDDNSASIRRSLLRDRLVLTSGMAGLRQIANRFLTDFLGPDWTSQVTMIEVDSVPIAVTLVREHGYGTILPAHVDMSAHGISQFGLPPSYKLPLYLAWRDNARGRQMRDRIKRLSAGA